MYKLDVLIEKKPGAITSKIYQSKIRILKYTLMYTLFTDHWIKYNIFVKDLSYALLLTITLILNILLE